MRMKTRHLKSAYGFSHEPLYSDGLDHLAYFVEDNPDGTQRFRNAEGGKTWDIYPFRRHRLDRDDPVILRNINPGT